nr:putative reverse transcriptase domain-containing protein [Tanacetum cinerariifolium]
MELKRRHLKITVLTSNTSATTGASGNSDYGATTVDGAGKIGAAGIFRVEVVGDDDRDATLLLYIVLQIREVVNSLMDQPLTMNKYQARAPRQIDDKLNFIEEPIKIMDREVKRLKESHILIMKVLWNSRRGPEFTWEREDQKKKKYLHLFTNVAPTSKDTS